jgi:photosystem II stability/assembly factor-like uncharacterized protein
MLPNPIRYHKFVIRPLALLALAVAARAQSPLENNGKPMRVPFECTEADTQAAGLSCSEDEPCPVFLELSSIDAAGNKIFLAGNLHTSTTTLSSILLASEDAGKTFSEPHPRIRLAGLDQIQFIDFQNGWISGAILQSAPRDPFLLLTTDGGKTWHQRPIFDEPRVAAIERVWFDSRENGTLLIDARLDNNLHELYETRTGGESWSMKQASANPIPFPRARDAAASGWRVRADAPTHSFDVEKSDGAQWQQIAGFLVDVGACKQ